MHKQEVQKVKPRRRRSSKKYCKPSQLATVRLSTIFEDDELDFINPQTGQEKTSAELVQDAHVELSSGSRVLEGLDPSGRILIHHSTKDNQIM